MAFIGLPCPTNKTGIREVFSPDVINLDISLLFMAFSANGDRIADPINDHLFML
jgi:hypothetical protein